MDATRNPSRQTEAVGQIVKQLQPAMPATVEQRLRELVVKSMTIPETASKTAVDQLTKAFETFSVNLLQQVQLWQSFQQTDGFYKRYPGYGQHPFDRQYPGYGQQLLANTDSLGSAFGEGLS